MRFEFQEDEAFFRDLLCARGESLDRYHELFDDRPPRLKRVEFARMRQSALVHLMESHGARCLLRYEHVCDAASGWSIDHIIPLASNKLNKQLRRMAALVGRKVVSQSFGSNNIRNLILACKNCNGHKKHRFLDRERLRAILALKFSVVGSLVEIGKKNACQAAAVLSKVREK